MTSYGRDMERGEGLSPVCFCRFCGLVRVGACEVQQHADYFGVTCGEVKQVERGGGKWSEEEMK